MYAKILNDQLLKYPYTLNDLQQENPLVNYSIVVNIIRAYADTQTAKNDGSFLVEITPTPFPTYDRSTKKVRELSPALVSGMWTQIWSIEDLTDEERATVTVERSREVREIRNELLKSSDWTQLKDISNERSQLFSIYRQALRDVPNQAGFPWNVEWPELLA